MLKGISTALVTPFSRGKIDFLSLKRLLLYQSGTGVSSLTVAGTTGESATLTEREKLDLLSFCRENSTLPIIFGTGSNDTKTAVRLTRLGCENGASACLVITPYCNKCSTSGLISHYFAVADASTKPIIIYNVPSRTGVNISPETYLTLATHPNIIGVKEADPNLSKTAETLALVKDFAVLCGSDELLLPFLSIGASGGISVVSNLLPTATAKIYGDYISGDLTGAKTEFLRLTPLIKELFSTVNPIPVKTALSILGLIKEGFRLPLTKLDKKAKTRLKNLLKEYF